jgi:hypothetical protein
MASTVARCLTGPRSPCQIGLVSHHEFAKLPEIQVELPLYEAQSWMQAAESLDVYTPLPQHGNGV